MRSLYRIMTAAGTTLCYQAARSAEQAVDIAKLYGHRLASKAEFVCEYL